MPTKNASEKQVYKAIKQLSHDVRDFWTPSYRINRVDSISPLEFYREYVSKSVPVIITREMQDWPALRKWSNKYFSDEIGDTEVTVDITPTGFGDCVVPEDCLLISDYDVPKERTELDGIFVKPEERKMAMRKFIEIFSSDSFDGVPYLSHQNDSLREEFPMLEQDIPKSIDFASVAFGNEPEAVNLWIGDERAVSSVHKDHYENMYCVVKGKKHFTLLPPSDTAYLYEQEYPTGRYQHCQTADNVSPDYTLKTQSKWQIHMEPDALTPWIPVDPLYPNTEQYPMLKYATPIECTIHEGEMLYLPAMWYHRVTQLCPTIAVNYWYVLMHKLNIFEIEEDGIYCRHDMEFDCRYVYYSFIRNLIYPEQMITDQDNEDAEE